MSEQSGTKMGEGAATCCSGAGQGLADVACHGIGSRLPPELRVQSAVDG